MFDDNDRLQQMEDNWNGDSIFQALGVQQNTMRKVAKEVEQDNYDQALEYFLDEGYPQAMAEEYASQQINLDDTEGVW